MFFYSCHFLRFLRFIFFNAFKINKKLSCRKETVRLLRGSALVKLIERGYFAPNLTWQDAARSSGK